MHHILHIETSESICSVAISKGQYLLAYKEVETGRSHASQLAVITDEIMSECKLTYQQLDAVAVSKGPGSYTGLRIGVSFAKGLCYALNIPIISVSTLEALFHGYINSHRYRSSFLSELKNIYFCPMLDARRMEVYSCLYQSDGALIRATEAEIINADSFSEILKVHPIIFIGSGAEKCKQVIEHENAYFETDFYPKAKSLIPLANKAYQNKEFENTAYFEPFYLKDFNRNKT
jgi:tRNA threonylcarbamoyladenosine biosynthesis protein TsaB